MAKEPTKAELKRTVSRLQSPMWPAIASMVNAAIKWIALVWIAVQGRDSVIALSGKLTVADIRVNFMAEVVAYVACAGGLGYGVRQKKLRQSTIERLQGRIRELESAIDPGRTSSGLTTRGETHPRDEV